MAEREFFISRAVADEIIKTDDNLSHWLLGSGIEIQEITEGVSKKLTEIYNHNPSHKYLVDNRKQRSLADPWVIAHAMHAGATIVTKETFATGANNIRIPNVCANLDIKCINDFEMLKELSVTFSCSN